MKNCKSCKHCNIDIDALQTRKVVIRKCAISNLYIEHPFWNGWFCKKYEERIKLDLCAMFKESEMKYYDIRRKEEAG